MIAAREQFIRPVNTREDAMAAGYSLRNWWGTLKTCPRCGHYLVREEWGASYTPTICLDACTCGHSVRAHVLAIL